ncbi:MAG TPA: hypothetical protein PK388_01380 [Kiritimatiellia bacterium]|nr:hypothetical protein [Kiritimatiellia bacterium]
MPARLLFLFVCVLALAARPLRAEDTNLVLRLFPVSIDQIHSDRPPTNFFTEPYLTGASKEASQDIKEFYRKCGVMFPPGAYVAYDPRASLLHHFNTEENQKRFGQIVRQVEGITCHVQLDATFVDFPRAQIEQLARGNGRAAPDTAALRELWTSGKGTLLHTLKLITRSGVNAQMQSVSEIIYPTEFRTPDATNSADSAAAPLPVPDTFDTREVGAILNVTPTVGLDNRTIDVVMAPEITAPPEWRTLAVSGTDADGRKLLLEVPQPVFHSRNITTSIVLKDGETAVLGGMENPAGDALTYLFLTVTLVDPAGRPLADYAGDTPP